MQALTAALHNLDRAKRQLYAVCQQTGASRLNTLEGLSHLARETEHGTGRELVFLLHPAICT